MLTNALFRRMQDYVYGLEVRVQIVQSPFEKNPRVLVEVSRELFTRCALCHTKSAT